MQLQLRKLQREGKKGKQLQEVGGGCRKPRNLKVVESLHQLPAQNIAKVRKVDVCGCKISTFCNYRERLESCENCSCDMTSRCILGWPLCIGLPPLLNV